jgi:hypothetical protein
MSDGTAESTHDQLSAATVLLARMSKVLAGNSNPSNYFANDGLVPLQSSLLLDLPESGVAIANKDAFGNVTVDSHVRTVVAIFGNVELGSNAEVDQEVVCVMGNVLRDPGAIAWIKCGPISTRSGWTLSAPLSARLETLVSDWRRVRTARVSSSQPASSPDSSVARCTRSRKR